MLGNTAPAAGRHDVGRRVDRSTRAEAGRKQLVTRPVVEMKGDRRPEIPNDVLPRVDPVEDPEKQNPQEQRLVELRRPGLGAPRHECHVRSFIHRISSRGADFLGLCPACGSTTPAGERPRLGPLKAVPDHSTALYEALCPCPS